MAMRESTRERKEQEIRNLTSQLVSTASDIGDWKISKYYEYVLAGEDAPYDISELHSARQSIRDEINSLQAELDADSSTSDEDE